MCLYICMHIHICSRIYIYLHICVYCFCLVTQLCSAPLWPTDCSLPGFSVHRISQARIVEWAATSFSHICTHIYTHNQSILKEISPGISLEGMMLKLKLQYFGHLMRRVDSLEKTDAGRDWGQEEKGTIEDEMAGWHHWLDGHESEWTPGVGDGQGGLACYNSWGRKESDTTELIHRHNGILFSLKKKILSHTTTYMNLEDIILSEISQSHKD